MIQTVLSLKKLLMLRPNKAISTIYQVGSINSKPYVPEQNDNLSVKKYLNSQLEHPLVIRSSVCFNVCTQELIQASMKNCLKSLLLR